VLYPELFIVLHILTVGFHSFCYSSLSNSSLSFPACIIKCFVVYQLTTVFFDIIRCSCFTSYFFGLSLGRPWKLLFTCYLPSTLKHLRICLNFDFNTVIWDPFHRWNTSFQRAGFSQDWNISMRFGRVFRCSALFVLFLSATVYLSLFKHTGNVLKGCSLFIIVKGI
jgi:hypothetical protein